MLVATSRCGRGLAVIRGAPARWLQTPGLFGVPGLQQPADFIQLATNAITQCQSIVDNVISPPLKRDAVLQLDELSNALCCVMDAAELCRNVHPKAEWLDAAQNSVVLVSGFMESLNTNVHLYEALREAEQLYGKDWPADWQATSAALLRDFEQHGIALPEDERLQLLQVHEELNQVAWQFLEGTNQFDPVWLPSNGLVGVSEAVKSGLKRHPEDFSLVRVPLDEPSVRSQLLCNTALPEVRRAVYEGIHSAPHNMQHLEQLLQMRLQYAQLLGGSSYGECALSRTMAGSSEEVTRFLQDLQMQVDPKAAAEASDLLSLKHKQEGADCGPLTISDQSYYMAHARHNNGVDGSYQYFSVTNCMNGIEIVLRKVFGLALKDVSDSVPQELWCPSVSKFELQKLECGTPIGQVYLDLEHRPGKGPGAAHYTIRAARRLGVPEEAQLPAVALVCSFAPRAQGMPQLLNHLELETVFHEWGHALHTLLSTTDLQHLSGTRCVMDFCETPSTLMERFVWDWRVLSQFAFHYSTGEVIPQRMVEELARTRKQFAATELQQQIAYSMADQTFHSAQPLAQSPATTLHDLQEQYTRMKPERGSSWVTRFAHLQGYGAVYYSYIWVRVFASNLWVDLFEHDPLSRDAGFVLQDKILRHGGARDPALMLKDVLGLDYLCTRQMLKYNDCM